MNILVCVKQVPDTTQIDSDQDRSGKAHPDP